MSDWERPVIMKALRWDNVQCTFCDGDGFGPMYIGNCPRCGGSGKEPDMTTVTTQVGEVHMFTADDLDAIEAALSIAAQHYSTMAGVIARNTEALIGQQEFARQFDKQAEEARALVLRIQAHR